MINDPDLWITAPRKTQQQLKKSCQLISHVQDDIIQTDQLFNHSVSLFFFITNVSIIVLVLTKKGVVHVFWDLLC